jgi:hypothetical protein
MQRGHSGRRHWGSMQKKKVSVALEGGICITSIKILNHFFYFFWQWGLKNLWKKGEIKKTNTSTANTKNISSARSEPVSCTPT